MGYGLSLLAGILIARLMGKDLYGEYGMIKNTLLYVAIISTFGLGITATKFIAESIAVSICRVKNVYAGTLVASLSISFLMAAVLFLGANEIASFIKLPTLVCSIKIVAFILIFNSVNTAQMGIMAGASMFREIAYSRVIYGLCVLLFSVVLFYYWGFNGAVLALLGSYFLSCVVNFFYIRKRLRLSIGQICGLDTFKTIKFLLSSSIPIFLYELIYAITRWVNSYLIGTHVNYGELGIYTAASQWGVVILFIPNILRSVVLSHLSKSASNKRSHQRVLFLMLLVGTLATLLPAIIIALGANFIVQFYGETYHSMVFVLRLVALATIFDCWVELLSQEYISVNKAWLMSGARTVADISVTLITYLLIQKFSLGAEGLVLANMLVRIFLASFLIFKCLSYNRFVKDALSR